MYKRFRLLLSFMLIVSMLVLMNVLSIVTQSEESGLWLRHYSLGENPSESLIYVPPSTDTSYDRVSLGSDLSFVIDQVDDGISQVEPFVLMDPDNDQRVRVYRTTTSPYYAIVNIRVKFVGNSGWYSCGTGFLVSENVVLTAAHCLYWPSYGAIEQIIVYPGRNGNTVNARAEASDYYIYDQYQDRTDFDNDFAVIVLDENIGNTTGWFQLYVPASDSDLNGRSITITGYPDDLASQYGEYFMWTDSGSVTAVLSHTFNCNVDITAGQSGSPAYFYNSGYKALGVLVAEYAAGGYNICRRIDATMYDWLDSRGYIN